MTTSRFSVVAGVVLSGCAQNLPPSDTELGQIARLGSVVDTEAALQSYARRRQGNLEVFKSELVAAGFTRRAIDPSARGPWAKCEYFDWKGREWGSLFQKGMIVGFCFDGIHTSSGYDAL